MNHFARSLVLCCLVCFSTAQAQKFQPGLALFSFDGSKQYKHLSGDPLLLYLVIDYSIAKRIAQENTRNQQLLADYRKTDYYRALSDWEQTIAEVDFPIVSIPEISIGSEEQSIVALLEFVMLDAQGQKWPITARPLANTLSQQGAVTLDSESPLSYQFVIDSGSLSAFAAGAYQLQLKLDTVNQPDMWQGQVFSNSLVLSLNQPDQQGWQGSGQHSLLLGRYLLDDKQFAKARNHAQAWTARETASINAWSQLAEAEFGLQNYAAARAAADTAELNFRSKHGDRPREVPQDLINLLNKINSFYVAPPPTP